MRIRHTIAAVLTVAALALTTACTDTTNSSSPTPAANRPAPIADTSTEDDHTDLVFQITWAQTSETQKDNTCTALALYGPEFAADEMQNGAGGSTELNWDRMAELLGDECDAR